MCEASPRVVASYKATDKLYGFAVNTDGDQEQFKKNVVCKLIFWLHGLL